jgi:hypothetical protein
MHYWYLIMQNPQRCNRIRKRPSAKGHEGCGAHPADANKFASQPFEIASRAAGACRRAVQQRTGWAGFRAISKAKESLAGGEALIAQVSGLIHCQHRILQGATA